MIRLTLILTVRTNDKWYVALRCQGVRIVLEIFLHLVNIVAMQETLACAAPKLYNCASKQHRPQGLDFALCVGVCHSKHGENDQKICHKIVRKNVNNPRLQVHLQRLWCSFVHSAHYIKLATHDPVVTRPECRQKREIYERLECKMDGWWISSFNQVPIKPFCRLKMCQSGQSINDWIK